MFDAGAIEASLTVRLDQFNADLDRAEQRVRKFETAKHEVRVSAVFDSASFSKARKMFSDLDQQISRDAAQRLRTSPQGSVLGSLNALFSPHPVTGSPTPAQSGQQGQLGKMFNTPGAGGGNFGPAPAPPQQPAQPSQRQYQRDSSGRFISGGSGAPPRQSPVPEPEDAVPPGWGSPGGRQRDSSGRFTSSQSQNQSQQDEGILRRVFSGLFSSSGGGRFFGAGTRASNAKQQVEDTALFKSFNSAFGHVRSGASSVAGAFGGSKFFGNLSNAALPGILGLSTKTATGIGIGGSALGALPALLGPLAALGVGGAGAGVLALGAKTLIGTKNQAGQPATQGVLYDPAQKALAALQGSLQKAAQPLVKPLEQAFGQLPKLIKGLTPALTQLFAGASTLIQPFLQGITTLAKDVLPGLGMAFRAVAPLMAPFLDSVGQLFKNLLPGLLSMLKSVQPILGTLESILGTAGKQLGALFADFAPVMKPAAVLLKALLDLVLSFLPLIGQLAKIFASSLAPAFQLFAGLLKQLTPVLIPIGKILAELAGAVLSDLISILQPLVSLIGQLSPTFATLAGVLGDVFNTLENAGVFQVLADALYTVVTPLATFINLLVKELSPFIPPLLQILNSLINAGIQVFTDAILALLPILTKLVEALLPPLLQVVISLVPVIDQLAVLMARGLGDAITALAAALTPVILIVAHLITGLIGWLNSTHLLLPVLALILLAIDPIPTAIGLIAIAIGYLAEHWQRIWGDIKQWAMDAWNFIWNGFGKYLLPLLGPVGIIALGAIELYQHWNTIWGLIKQVAHDFYQWIWTDFGAKISDFLTKTLPNAFDSAVSGIKTAWNTVEDVFKTPVNFLIQTVYDNGIAHLWNEVMGAIGLSSLKLPSIKPLATGGRITDGTGPTADDVLVRVSRGETVVSAAHSKMLAPIFAAAGVPGYAGGGIIGDVLGAAGAIVSSGGGATGVIGDVLSGNWGSLTDELLKLIGVPGGTVGDLAKMLLGVPKKIVSDAVSAGKKMLGSAANSLIYGPAGAARPSGAGPTANAALARQLAPLFGVPSWASGADWQAWNLLTMRESGWNNTAKNPSSGAYGIPQALPYTKMDKGAWPPSAGGMADPTLQIKWMINYILGRYGTPETAWGHELAFGWYGNGLDAIFSHPTVIGVGEKGAEHVSVTPLASYGPRTARVSADQILAAVARTRPMIGTYQTAFYGTGDTAYALRELTRTMRTAELQAAVVGP